jgi:methionine--tRNA ligase beta chain
MINFEHFKQLDIKIGTVIEAETIPNADKLLKLQIDLGTETRQVLAGIAEFIDDPKDLIGKQIPVLTNLEPRTMRGLESQGMILAAEDGGPVLLHPEKEVPNGSPVM